MPKKIDHIIYVSVSDFEKAAVGLILRIFNFQSLASKNKMTIIRSLENFLYRKYMKRMEHILLQLKFCAYIYQKLNKRH